jgi:hypothetical protein
MALTYNRSYSRGRDQKHHSSKLAGANSSRDPISKKPIIEVGQGEGPMFKPQYQKKRGCR